MKYHSPLAPPPARTVLGFPVAVGMGVSHYYSLSNTGAGRASHFETGTDNSYGTIPNRDRFYRIRSYKGHSPNTE